jgi:hypothetical protein
MRPSSRINGYTAKWPYIAPTGDIKQSLQLIETLRKSSAERRIHSGLGGKWAAYI